MYVNVADVIPACHALQTTLMIGIDVLYIQKKNIMAPCLVVWKHLCQFCKLVIDNKKTYQSVQKKDHVENKYRYKQHILLHCWLYQHLIKCYHKVLSSLTN